MGRLYKKKGKAILRMQNNMANILSTLMFLIAS